MLGSKLIKAKISLGRYRQALATSADREHLERHHELAERVIVAVANGDQEEARLAYGALSWAVSDSLAKQPVEYRTLSAHLGSLISR